VAKTVRSSSAKSNSKKWSPLQPGDIVEIIAPASSCAPERLDGAIQFLIDWGLKPRVARNIFGRDVICANDDASRLAQLKQALLAPDSAAVWCLRGGYGANRLIPDLLKMRAPENSKLFIGLSDITSLNVFLNQEWGWSTVHGPMLDRLGRGETKSQYLREIKKFVFGEEDKIRFAKLKPMNEAARATRVVKGAVTGGNIVTLQSTLGTRMPWDCAGKIVFMEEIGERGYRVDRILEHFRQAGCFDKARAVVFGDFTGGEEPDGKSRAPRVIRRFASLLSIPVLSGIQSGHGVIQRPLPLGTPSELRLKPGESELVCSTGVGA
jgi:muramoyltetrapeptide carboxypeptidase